MSVAPIFALSSDHLDITTRNHTALLPAPGASWVRKQLAEAIRSRHPYSVNLLLGGYDQTSSESHLYWLDYLGTIARIPYAAHGYASYLTLSTLDRYHDPNMTVEEGLRLLRRCVNELEKRLVINLCVSYLISVFHQVYDLNEYSQGRFQSKSRRRQRGKGLVKRFQGCKSGFNGALKRYLLIYRPIGSQSVGSGMLSVKSISIPSEIESTLASHKMLIPTMTRISHSTFTFPIRLVTIHSQSV